MPLGSVGDGASNELGIEGFGAGGRGGGDEDCDFPALLVAGEDERHEGSGEDVMRFLSLEEDEANEGDLAESLCGQENEACDEGDKASRAFPNVPTQHAATQSTQSTPKIPTFALPPELVGIFFPPLPSFRPPQSFKLPIEVNV
jgi:hypothetical protein